MCLPGSADQDQVALLCNEVEQITDEALWFVLALDRGGQGLVIGIREALAPQACLSVPAGPLDQSVIERLLSAITPVTIELAIAALTSLEQRDHEIGAQWRMRIERARYEADRRAPL